MNPGADSFFKHFTNALNELKSSVSAWESLPTYQLFNGGVPNDDQWRALQAVVGVETWLYAVLLYINDILESIVWARIQRQEPNNLSEHLMESWDSEHSHSFFSEWLIDRALKFDLLSQEEVTTILDAYRFARAHIPVDRSMEVAAIKKYIELFEELGMRLKQVMRFALGHDTIDS